MAVTTETTLMGRLVTEDQLKVFRSLDSKIVKIYRETPDQLKVMLDEMDQKVLAGDLNLANDFYDEDNDILMQEYYDCVYNWFIERLMDLDEEREQNSSRS